MVLARQAAALVTDDDARAEVADELADVLFYCLSFANAAPDRYRRRYRTKLARNRPLSRRQGEWPPRRTPLLTYDA